MNAKLLNMTLIVGFIAALTTLPLNAAAPASKEPPRLISAESLGYADYDALMAGLQDKIDRSDASDQGWFTKLWEWICYVLHDVLHDPRVVEYVKIEYWTTTAAGDWIPVTGLAILPRPHGTLQTVPMISFQHPTEVERKDSPSMFNMTNMWDDPTFDVPIATLYAQAGFALALPDYPGMGSNTNVHPYCTESLANCVVDMIRAVRDYLQANTNIYAQWDSRLYLTGYSEGGYATVMAARDLQNLYSNEFTVSAVAGLDGPYSLSDTMRGIMLNADTNFSSPYFLPYTVNGYDSVYAALDPIFCFTNAVKYSVPTEPDFAVKLQRMCLAGTNTGAEMNNLMFKATPYVGPRSILTDTYIAGLSNTSSTLCKVLASNDAYQVWTPQMKMRLYHYPNDDLVPYGNSTNAYNAFAARKAPQTELMSYGGDWPLNWLIEWLKEQMDSSYHAAAAPVAYVKGILWLYDLAYGQAGYPQLPPNDMDGDLISDLALYDENTGVWQMLLSHSGFAQITLGGFGYMPSLNDFDGDGKADPCVYHAAWGIWTVRLSLLDYVSLTFPLGGGGSLPVPQDYDGDRMADPCVYNPQSGIWSVYLIPGNQLLTVPFGGFGCIPVKGDFDGDRKADPAVYRADGVWFVALSKNNYITVSAPCGGPGYIPMPADYDGDGKTDPCVYREASLSSASAQIGAWRMLLSGGNYAQVEFNYGGPGFTPVIGDYDASGKAAIMLYYENIGVCSGILSANGYTASCWFFGGLGNAPVW